MRLIGTRLTSVYWWGAVAQVIGTTAFGVASMYGIFSLVIAFEVGGTINVRTCDAPTSKS